MTVNESALTFHCVFTYLVCFVMLSFFVIAQTTIVVIFCILRIDAAQEKSEKKIGTSVFLF